MAVSKKHRHPSPEVIYNFVKGGLDRQHLEEVQAHVKSCPRCAALVTRGRLILKWLRTWSVPAQNLAYDRVLLRDGLRRASARTPGKGVSRRLTQWRGNAPARYAAVFSVAAMPEGGAEPGTVTDLSLLPERAPGLRVEAGGRVSGRRGEGTVWGVARPQRRAGGKPAIRLEVTGRKRLLVRGEFDLGDSPAPLVLLMACRHRAEPQLKAMRRVGGSRDRFEARFAGLDPGRYIVALEPAHSWLGRPRGPLARLGWRFNS